MKPYKLLEIIKMKLSKRNIILIGITILLTLVVYTHFKMNEYKQIANSITHEYIPEEVKYNANRLCSSMWPGAEDIQDKCIYEQIEAGKKVYNNYINKYIINLDEIDQNNNDITIQEKNFIVKKCLEYGQLILFDNTFALDYVEILKCCEYSFSVWGFQKSSWYQYVPSEEGSE